MIRKAIARMDPPLLVVADDVEGAMTTDLGASEQAAGQSHQTSLQEDTRFLSPLYHLLTIKAKVLL